MSDEEKVIQEESTFEEGRVSESEIGTKPKRKFPITLVVGLVLVLAVVGILGGRALLLNGGAGEEQVVSSSSTPAYASASSSQDTTAVQGNTRGSVTSSYAENSNALRQCVVATEQDGIQYLTSSMDGVSYQPVSVKQNVPVKWTLNVPAGSLNSCNDAIHIPAWGVEMPLVEGDNIIEFTPDMSGIFQYSCWMDMIFSSVTVVGEDGTVADYTDIDLAALEARDIDIADCC